MTHTSHCIRCGEPLHTCEQHWTHKPQPTVMVDCRNRACGLYMVTASAETYFETVNAFCANPTDGWKGKGEIENRITTVNS